MPTPPSVTGAQGCRASDPRRASTRRATEENPAMLRPMRDMPPGTIGFEAVGEVEDDDWEEAVEPVLRREIATRGAVRLLYLLGPDADDVESDAMKADTVFRGRHGKAFERVAVVTDESWMKPA